MEDHAITREILADYIAIAPDVELCGMAASAEDAVHGLAAARASLVLLDLSLPGRSGLDLLTEINVRWQLPCVVLSGHGDRSYVGRAFAAGARGYLLKGHPQEVAGALRRVMDGEIYLSDSLRDALDHEPDVPS